MLILYLLRSLPGLFLLEMPVNPSQYRGSVGIFNNRNFFVQSKLSHFSSYLSDNNTTTNNTNLKTGLLFLLKKTALVLLLLNLMVVFKDDGFKHKKITFIWALFSTLAFTLFSIDEPYSIQYNNQLIRRRATIMLYWWKEGRAKLTQNFSLKRNTYYLKRSNHSPNYAWISLLVIRFIY